MSDNIPMASAEINVTEDMIEAGVIALEARLIEGESIQVYRPQLVTAVYRAMVCKSDRRPG